jgi:hypothetical protein
MWVEVVLLRAQGRRLTREQLEAARRLRGHISVVRAPAGRLPLGQWEPLALLKTEPEGVEPMAELHHARLLHWDARGLVLAGVEQTWHRQQRTDFRQAWWVQPSIARGSPQGAALDLSDFEERIEQIVERLLLRLGSGGL